MKTVKKNHQYSTKKKIIFTVAACVLAAALIVGVYIFFDWYLSRSGDKVADSLPGFETSTVYSNSGSDKFIEYGVFKYDGVDAADLDENKYFKKIDLSNIEDLLSAVEIFSDSLDTALENDSATVSTVEAYYDFTEDMIKASNYFHVEIYSSGEIKEDEAHKLNIENCDKFRAYYFDLESQTLYYFYIDKN